MQNQLKHQQFILALDKRYITDELKCAHQRVTPVELQTIIQTAAPHLVLRQRAWLEQDKDYLQILPIITFFREKAGKVQEVFAYRRTSKVGESRLVGKVSIHVGGHVDADGVLWNLDNTIDLQSTLDGCLRREGSEEVAYDLELHGRPEFAGLIYDNSDDVGQHHVAFHYIVVLKEGVELTIQEEELTQIGFLDLDELSEKGAHADVYADMENWPKIALLHLEPEQFGS